MFHDRRTYGATLAELTSLEELMRTMMTENMIHNDVITKLWQVYSKSYTPCLLVIFAPLRYLFCRIETED